MDQQINSATQKGAKKEGISIAMREMAIGDTLSFNIAKWGTVNHAKFRLQTTLGVKYTTKTHKDENTISVTRTA